MRRAYRALIAETERHMSEEQKDRIIEAVQMAKDGFITRTEMVTKIQQVAEIEEFEETIG